MKTIRPAHAPRGARARLRHVSPLLFALAMPTAIGAHAAAAIQFQASALVPVPLPVFLGGTVAASGDTVLVGALQAAYVFVRQGESFVQQAVLTLPPGLGDRYFGSAVALSGDTALVCSTGSNSNAPGMAYVFVRTAGSWELQATLAARRPLINIFCASTALSGDTAVIGAITLDSNQNATPEAAYVFVREGTAWHQQAVLTNGKVGGELGYAVAVSGDNVAVGAYLAGFESSGLVYMYRRDGTSWVADGVIMVPDIRHHPLSSAAALGYSVALSGDTLVAGAPAGVTPGQAYVFVREPGPLPPGSGPRWRQEAKLQPADEPSNFFNSFASSVSVSGDLAAIAAFAPEAGETPSPGSFYLFQRRGHTWRPLGRLDAPFTVPTSGGTVCAIDGNTVVLAADFNTSDPGAATAWTLAASAASKD